MRLAARFNGPPSSGNGGFASGALAAELADRLGAGPLTVQLRRPPPLETDLVVEERDGWWAALDGDEVVLRARTAEAEPRPVGPVGPDVARAAMASYAGLVSHPFPTCVVCGTERPDGLRVHPGRVDDDPAGPDGAARVASTWVPEEATTPWVWAALDCIGGWAGDLGERLMVLGTMTAVVHAAPEPGVEHVVVGGSRGGEGRKTWSAATLYAPDGTLLATAEHTWLAIDPKAFS